MSDRPKASAPKTPVSAAPARKAATAGAPAAKSGTGSWLAGFITRAAAGNRLRRCLYPVPGFGYRAHGHLCFCHERSVLL